MARYGSGQSLGARVRQTEKQADALGRSRAAEERKAMDAYLRSLTDEELDRLIAEKEEQVRVQQATELHVRGGR